MINLGGNILPKYKKFTIEKVELSTVNYTINGSVRKDVFSIKNRYIFEFENLKKNEANLIETLYNNSQAVALNIDMENLQVATTVILTISELEKKYSAQLSTFKLILEEI